MRCIIRPPVGSACLAPPSACPDAFGYGLALPSAKGVPKPLARESLNSFVQPSYPHNYYDALTGRHDELRLNG